ncbi:MAG: winged helix-turn-helix transcriptional regulator [DPANN group archaeon]|nr:winged helix-turn-helix transcriptional regulator [DPANN group archaeon]
MNPPHLHINEGNILDNHMRGTLYALITGAPGTTLKELLCYMNDHVGVSRESLRRHLKLLEEFSLIDARWEGGQIYYYAADVRRWDKISATQKAILLAAEKMPGASQQELSDKLGFLPNKISYHLKRLVEFGLARIDRASRNNKVYALRK